MGSDFSAGPVFVHYDRDVIRANATRQFPDHARSRGQQHLDALLPGQPQQFPRRAEREFRPRAAGTAHPGRGQLPGLHGSVPGAEMPGGSRLSDRLHRHRRLRDLGRVHRLVGEERPLGIPDRERRHLRLSPVLARRRPEVPARHDGLSRTAGIEGRPRRARPAGQPSARGQVHLQETDPPLHQRHPVAATDRQRRGDLPRQLAAPEPDRDHPAPHPAIRTTCTTAGGRRSGARSRPRWRRCACSASDWTLRLDHGKSDEFMWRVGYHRAYAPTTGRRRMVIRTPRWRGRAPTPSP